MSRDFDLLSNGEIGEDVQVETGFGESAYGALAEEFNSIYKLTLGKTSWSDRFETKLAAANMSTTADLWLSGASALGMIGGGLIGLVTFILAFTGILPIPVPRISLEFLPVSGIQNAENIIVVTGFLLVTLAYMGFGALQGILICGGIAVVIPYMKARSRKRKIEIVQPDAVGFMHALSVSGMNQMEVFRSVARSEDVYGEFAVEFQRITHQIDNFNTDFATAVREVSKTTPSKDLQKFLTGLLSTIGSGGSLSHHLEDAKDRERENRERKLESIVDYVMILGQSYMTLMILPMLLVIILVIMAVAGQPNYVMLAITVYALIPGINAVYSIMASTVMVDEVGDGYMQDDDGSTPGKVTGSPWDFSVVKKFIDEDPTFRHIARKEAEQRVKSYIFQNPFTFFVKYPMYILVLTVPATLLGWVAMYFAGVFKPSLGAMMNEPLTQTLVWVYWPLLVNMIPYAAFYEYRERSLAGIMDNIAEDFQALATINNTGAPLPQAMKVVSQDSESKMAEEFGIMYKKLQLNIPMSRSIIEMNNKYHIPRLARQLKILKKAQEVSSQIGEVLKTAAETAEYQHQINKKRQSKMNTQIVIIEGAFFVFLLIMAGMETAFVSFASETVEGAEEVIGGSTDVSTSLMGMLFLHAAFLQGVASGLLAGYIKHNDVSRGIKLALINAILVLVAWLLAPIILGFF
jgi:flagellar protein FlaJ